jgi:hypothetical protein
MAALPEVRSARLAKEVRVDGMQETAPSRIGNTTHSMGLNLIGARVPQPFHRLHAVAPSSAFFPASAREVSERG